MNLTLDVDDLVARCLFNLIETRDRKRRVIVSDLEGLESKLKTLLKSGPQALQVICDFDHTLSKHSINQREVPVCHGIFLLYSGFPENCKSQLKQLIDVYGPIEKDPTMTTAEKIPYMVEFWNQAHKTILEGNLHQTDIHKSVNESGIVLRTNASRFINKLGLYEIPLLIFSAGIGTVIDIILSNLNICKDNIRIVSNFMDFNSEGRLIGFQDPLIHSMNKTVEVIKNSEYYEAVLTGRPCILLLGDSLTDPNMINEKYKFGANYATVLRIGFLNTQAEKQLQIYQSLYDIVLIEDDTFDIPLQIINTIFRDVE